MKISNFRLLEKYDLGEAFWLDMVATVDIKKPFRRTEAVKIYKPRLSSLWRFADSGEIVLNGTHLFDTFRLKLNAHEYLTDLQNKLEILSNAGHAAMVAGGALRDHFLNKPIHDIDIYHNKPISDETILEVSGGGLIKETFSLETQDMEQFMVKYVDKGIKRIISCGIYQFMETSYEYATGVDNFDVGLSKIFLTLDGLNMTSDFLKDVSNKTIRCVLPRPEEHKELLLRYVTKISNKYPDYKVILPEFYKTSTNLIKY